MTDRTPEDPSADQPDVLAEDRDAEDIANEELPLDPASPSELGDTVDSLSRAQPVRRKPRPAERERVSALLGFV